MRYRADSNRLRLPKNKSVPFLVVAVVLMASAWVTPAGDLEDRILAHALTRSDAWNKLAHLTDRIGHRLSGSEALNEAIAWSTAEFERHGMDRVWTEEVSVPHWVRGAESASLVAPVEREMAVLALGGSVGTPASGITADVVEVDSFEGLEQVADSLEGKIVLYNRPIEPGFTSSPNSYGAVVELRGEGASRAAAHGAVGMLIRSLGTADYRLPHTGMLEYDEDVEKIPAAAIAAEDAELIHRLLASGDTVRAHLKLGCRTLPDAKSANVLAELEGREIPDEIVLIGAHLDSWDVGQGAHDDGAGCAIVMETMVALKSLGIAPRRTVRAVLFTNEENGLRGGRDYAARHPTDRHVAAIEADAGGAAPLGFGVTAGPGAVERVRELIEPLAVIGANNVYPRGGGADIGPIVHLQGTPALALVPDTLHYFDYHHTEADTLDKIDRTDLDRNVAALALMVWRLAEIDESLPPKDPTPSPLAR